MAVVVPELNELFEEAYERAGLEMRSGYDLKTARRSLNIMTLEWQNRGLNLFTIEAGTIPLVAGTATYTLPSDTIDLIEHQLAHAVRDPNGRAYNRTAHLPERQKMMQAWADYLDELRTGAEVIPFSRPA